jgi:hypothetical protein
LVLVTQIELLNKEPQQAATVRFFRFHPAGIKGARMAAISNNYIKPVQKRLAKRHSTAILPPLIQKKRSRRDGERRPPLPMLGLGAVGPVATANQNQKRDFSAMIV